MRFQLGTRVSRPADVFAKKSSILVGSVIWVGGYDLAWPWMLPMSSLVFEHQTPGTWRYPEVYAVAWDNGTTMTGILPHGIETEDHHWYNQ